MHGGDRITRSRDWNRKRRKGGRPRRVRGRRGGDGRGARRRNRVSGRAEENDRFVAFATTSQSVSGLGDYMLGLDEFLEGVGLVFQMLCAVDVDDMDCKGETRALRLETVTRRGLQGACKEETHTTDLVEDNEGDGEQDQAENPAVELVGRRVLACGRLGSVLAEVFSQEELVLEKLILAQHLLGRHLLLDGMLLVYLVVCPDSPSVVFIWAGAANSHCERGSLQRWVTRLRQGKALSVARTDQKEGLSVTEITEAAIRQTLRLYSSGETRPRGVG